MKKILIIEHDCSVKTHLQNIFEENGYHVFLASDGIEGVSGAMDIQPDLIICDTKVPGQSGYEVREELSKYESTTHIPVILLADKAKTNGLHGTGDYIIKPFRVPALLKAVETNLQRLEHLKNSINSSEPIENQLSEDERILVTVKSKTKFIRIGDIICITALGEYSTVNLTDGSKIILRKVLKEWESKLSSAIFLRIHRSTIVNLKHVARIEKWYNRTYRIFMQQNNQDFVISQRYAVKLKSRLSL